MLDGYQTRQYFAIIKQSMTMSKDTLLFEKRAELKRALLTGKYHTLISALFTKVGYVIPRLTRNSKPVSLWYGAAMLGLVNFLITCLLALLLGETKVLRAAPWLFASGSSALGLVLIGMLIIDRRYRNIFSILHDYLLEAIESVADLEDLQHWLALVSDPRKMLLCTLIYMIVVTPYAAAALSSAAGGFIGLGPIYNSGVVCFFQGVCFYYFLVLVSFHARLRSYRLKLYAADPSSSEIINQLSRMLTSNEYLLAVYMALYTLAFAATGVIAAFGIMTFIIGWLPVIAMFVLHHYALARIITTAKWKTLNEIQAKIERLQAQEDLPTKETLEHIGKLMDYHDRIRATHNSVFDIRAGLSFLNSLLLPMIAFAFANLDKVIALFHGP